VDLTIDAATGADRDCAEVCRDVAHHVGTCAQCHCADLANGDSASGKAVGAQCDAAISGADVSTHRCRISGSDVTPASDLDGTAYSRSGPQDHIALVSRADCARDVSASP